MKPPILPIASRMMRLAGAVALGTCAMFAQNVKRVEAHEAMQAAVTRIEPTYSQIARQLKIEGVVAVETTISAEGTVETSRLLEGNPILAKAVTEAVGRWKFTPFKESGKPVPVVCVLSFTFKL